MERLTAYNSENHKNVAYYPVCFEYPCNGFGCKIDGCKLDYEICQRLAAYEDTGLEPEQVMELKSFTQGGIHKVDDGWKHVQELLQAEKDGRLVVLPCIPGSDIYYLNNVDHEIVPMVLLGFDILPTVVMAQTSYGQSIPVSQFGENIFLTREEAEAAMKGGEG